MCDCVCVNVCVCMRDCDVSVCVCVTCVCVNVLNILKKNDFLIRCVWSPTLPLCPCVNWTYRRA